MKQLNTFSSLILVILISFFVSSCSAIEGIFKAGVWTGIFFVAAIIALVIFIIAKIGGGKKQ